MPVDLRVHRSVDTGVRSGSPRSSAGWPAPARAVPPSTAVTGGKRRSRRRRCARRPGRRSGRWRCPPRRRAGPAPVRRRAGRRRRRRPRTTRRGRGRPGCRWPGGRRARARRTPAGTRRRVRRPWSRCRCRTRPTRGPDRPPKSPNVPNRSGWRSASMIAQAPPSESPASAQDRPGGCVPKPLLDGGRDVDRQVGLGVADRAVDALRVGGQAAVDVGHDQHGGDSAVLGGPGVGGGGRLAAVGPVGRVTGLTVQEHDHGQGGPLRREPRRRQVDLGLARREARTRWAGR